MSEDQSKTATFSDFPLDSRVLTAVERLGFVDPTPIQVQAIPLLIEGCDLVGQAQTGTGKTAAFGLPLMGRIDPKSRSTQALILAPTRELALQVAQALKQFAITTPGLRVVPIYGGQEYGIQLRALRKGAHIVVGTPGRVMDHLRRGTMKLDGLKTIVLDEADEMLNMGFIEDIEWILGQCPEERQTSLFSATIPPRIRSIAKRYMREPKQVRIDKFTSAAPTIRQRYWLVRGLNKLDALSRILEAESLDAALIFVRTRTGTVELAEKLADRNLRASALHGDMPQAMREHTVRRLAQGQIDLLVATDVAARGLDIERFSHVINYDMPGDPDAYVHRIGRTGRAGREGQSISLVAPRERHLLKSIERMTKQKIENMDLPSAAQLNAKRIGDFKQELVKTLEQGELEPFLGILRNLSDEESLDPLELAAAMAKRAQGQVPLLVKDVVVPKKKPGRAKSESVSLEPGMARYRLEVGHKHGVTPSNIVGAIANEAGLQSRHIGRITINLDHSLVDLPEGMPQRVFDLLRAVQVCQVPLNLSRVLLAKAGQRPKFFKSKNRPGPKTFDPKTKAQGNKRASKPKNKRKKRAFLPNRNSGKKK